MNIGRRSRDVEYFDTPAANPIGHGRRVVLADADLRQTYGVDGRTLGGHGLDDHPSRPVVMRRPAL